jgi:Zn-dependent protease
MIKSSYTLCTLFGIPIRLDLSLLLLLFFMGGFGNPFYDILGALLLLISIALHELGHSLAAQAFGCRVLDITLMIFGGCASLERLPRKQWQELLVALAGPAVSLLLGVAGLLAPIYLHASGLLSTSAANFLIAAVGVRNIGLLLFNLLPAFPMDGGRVLRAALQFRMSKLRATWIASRVGRVLAGAMVCFAACNILHIPLPKPDFPGVVGDLFWYFLSGGTFLKLLVGLMIFQAAEAEYRMVLAEEGADRTGPFAGFPFFRRATRTPPPDDGHAVVSPPPYERRGSTRVDVRKD